MRKLNIFPVTIMGDPEIEDEVPRPSRVLEVADNLDVATREICCLLVLIQYPLHHVLLSPRVTGRDAELCSHLMTGCTEERPKNLNRYHPVVRLGGT